MRIDLLHWKVESDYIWYVGRIGKDSLSMLNIIQIISLFE